MLKTMTIALAGLALTGLAACGDLDDRIVEEAKEAIDASDIPVAGAVTDAAEAPAADLPDVDPVDPVVDAPEGTSLEFVEAANDAGITDDIDDIGAHFNTIAGYSEDFDFAGAGSEARQAQALLQDMHTEALTLPGAGSPAGVATIEAFDVCYWAMDTTADAMDNVDIAALTTSVDAITACTDAIGHATDVISG